MYNYGNGYGGEEDCQTIFSRTRSVILKSVFLIFKVEEIQKLLLY